MSETIPFIIVYMMGLLDGKGISYTLSEDNTSLDMPNGGAAYAVFGKVIKGMDIVDKIKNVKCITHSKYPSRTPVTPEKAVIIKKVIISGQYDLNQLKTSVQSIVEAKNKEKIVKQEAETAQFNEYFNKLAKDTGKKISTTSSGLKYIILKEGNGPKPSSSASTVEVHYEGKLMNGTVFDSSYKRGNTIKFPLNRVIPGWTEGVGMMKTGAKWLLIIPPELGYGPRGAGTIPPNSWLIFTIELFSVN